MKSILCIVSLIHNVSLMLKTHPPADVIKCCCLLRLVHWICSDYFSSQTASTVLIVYFPPLHQLRHLAFYAEKLMLHLVNLFSLYIILRHKMQNTNVKVLSN